MELRDPRLKGALYAVVALLLAIAVFRLGDQASADVKLDDTTVWAEHGLAGELLQIHPATGEIMSRIVVGEDGDALAAIETAAGLVVLNVETNTMRVVDPATLEAGPTTPVELVDLSSDPFRPVASPIAEPVYLLTPSGLVGLDPSGDGASAESFEHRLTSGVIDNAGRLLGLDRDGPFVRRLTLNGFGPYLPLVAPDETAPDPVLVATGSGPFVVEPERLSVSPITSEGELGAPTCFTGLGTETGYAGSSPASTVVRIVGHDPASGVLSVAEPDRGRCFEIDLDFLGLDYGPPVVSGDFAYLPNWDLGRIDVVDLEAATTAGSVSFGSLPGEPFDLEVFGSAVVANEPLGPFVAIFDGAEAQTIQKIENVVVGGSRATDRGFGAATPLVAATGDEGAQALGAGGESIASGGETSGDGPTETVETEVFGVAVTSVAVDDAEPSDGLTSDFSFTSDTTAVGDPVRFFDQSTGLPTEWLWDFGDDTIADTPDVEKTWSEPGEFVVSLTVVDAVGNRSTSSATITVVPASVSLPPVADFVFDRASIEAGESIQFTSLSTGEPDTLEWSFGDGAVATGTQTEHTFRAVGQFTVTLTASNAAGSSQATTEITVVEATLPPVAIIAPLPFQVEVGQFVSFESRSRNDPTEVTWDFGDGSRASTSFTRHAFSDAGSYRVRLTVSNTAGSDTTVADIRVVPAVDPPIAQFSASTSTALTGEPIDFADQSLNEPTSFEWDFGDGISASGSTVSHTFERSGTFRVTLRVANEAGVDSRTKSIRIVDPVDPPLASFQVSATRVPQGSAVRFTDTSINEPNRWLWAFGDGATANEPSVEHTFAEPGTYVVKLRVGNKGGVDTSEQTIVVFGPPEPWFHMEPDGLSVTYWDKTEGDPTSWLWQASTGEESTEQNPTFSFPEAGSYDMTLVATNAAGSSAPVTQSIVVYEDADARFEWDADFLTVRFENRSRGGPTDYLWDFGDGSTSTEAEPTHTYAKGGAYEVTLTASNPVSESTETRRVRVEAEPLDADFDCELDGTTVTCDASETTGAVSYSWSADGAQTITGENEVVATFEFPPCRARYRIVLDVTAPDGDTDRRSRRTPQIGDREAPSIDRVEEVSDDNLVVTLQAILEDDPASTWTWTVEGGELVSGGDTASPTFSFAEPGRYDGTVVAGNACGVSSPRNFTVRVAKPPDAEPPEETEP